MPNGCIAGAVPTSRPVPIIFTCPARARVFTLSHPRPESDGRNQLNQEKLNALGLFLRSLSSQTTGVRTGGQVPLLRPGRQTCALQRAEDVQTARGHPGLFG